MAGNIPPLVSSTPPPLNAFDDDEEEEEDEFGLYNAAEEIDYNECISFREKDEEKQNVGVLRGEQDSTSQDSATDSGLCPDSEGMSPTHHSDDEGTLKQNSCDKLCQKTGEQPRSSESELIRQGTASVNLDTVPCPNLPNGHVEEDHCGQESDDDDFGNFEFAPSQRTLSDAEGCREGVLRSESPSNMKYSEEEHNGGNVCNSNQHNEQFTEKVEEEKSPEYNISESNLNGLDFEDSDRTSTKEDTCKYEQSSIQSDEFTIDSFDTASNDNSNFNVVDSSLEPKDITCSEYKKIKQHDSHSMEETAKEYLEDALKLTTENLDYREGKENVVTVENGDDDDFDDFTDFKADFSGCYELSKSEKGDKVNEHSKTFVEQTKSEEATLSLPPSHHEESDDEFSNFADFSSSDCAFVSAQSSNSLENVSHIPLRQDDCDMRTESEFQDWVSVFPCEDGETPAVASALLSQDDVVWARLFPLESSPALSYQWNESLANRRLLTSLNIDSRNILFTPWSTSAVPRFAANLSCGPLEPIKATEPLQPVVATPPSIITTVTATTTTTSTNTTTTTSTISTNSATTQVCSVRETVPDAHFDWASAGLTNPLDSCHSSLLDLNFVMTIETQLATSPKTVLNLPKTLSAEAEKILSLLQDISFMRKTYIDFPINET